MDGYSLLSHKEFAERILNRIRSGVLILSYLDLVHKHLRKAGCDASDIGSSSLELESFRVKVFQQRVLVSLNKLLNQGSQPLSYPSDYLDEIKKIINTQQLSRKQLHEIGITRTVLESVGYYRT